MEQIAERLAGRINRLRPDQMAEVERFVESLERCDRDQEMARMAYAWSAPALRAIWSNPEDDVYDAL